MCEALICYHSCIIVLHSVTSTLSLICRLFPTLVIYEKLKHFIENTKLMLHFTSHRFTTRTETFTPTPLSSCLFFKTYAVVLSVCRYRPLHTSDVSPLSTMPAAVSILLLRTCQQSAAVCCHSTASHVLNGDAVCTVAVPRDCTSTRLQLLL
jgi:hypothetical protein